MKKIKANNVLLIAIALLNFITVSCSQDQSPSEASVNKSLLFMEEELQKINGVQLNRGNAYRMEVRSEMFGFPQNERNGGTFQKLEYVLQRMDLIDVHAAKLIQYIDQLKVDLLTRSGAETGTIILGKGEGTVPMRLNLYELKAPSDQVIITDSIKLYRSIKNYRDSLVFLCANYEWGGKSYTLPIINTMEDYSTYEEFLDELESKLETQTYNYMDDRSVLSDLYIELSRTAWKVIDQRNTSLLTNLCLLSVLQQDILSSRALAFGHWKSKVSTGEYSFDALTAIVQGPEIVEVGKSPEYKIFYAATDSSQEPEIVVSSPGTASVKKNNDGSYSLILSAEKPGTVKLSGTLTITNKSGIKRTEPWEKSVVIR